VPRGNPELASVRTTEIKIGIRTAVYKGYTSVDTSIITPTAPNNCASRVYSHRYVPATQLPEYRTRILS
jgi:hypothetical protein